MATDRTPEEREHGHADRMRVRAVIDQARRDVTSWHLAEHLDEPPSVCEDWINRVWNGLSAGLDAEDRILAVVDLIEDECHERAEQMLRDGLA